MRQKIELKLLRSIKTGKGLIKLINNLKLTRRKNKIQNKKRSRLSPKQRKEVLAKTDCRCHICGISLSHTDFQADHIQSHITGGKHRIDNYLPSCATCNNYRWHYSSEEIQIILKLGVWAKTKLLTDNTFNAQLANDFVKHEMNVRKRRKAKQAAKAS
jgi:predicted restriction endonuclease